MCILGIPFALNLGKSVGFTRQSVPGPSWPGPGRVGNWRGGRTPPFPVPAASNGACGFSALRSPARFGATVMRLRPAGPLSGRVWYLPAYSTLSHRFPLHLAL